MRNINNYIKSNGKLLALVICSFIVLAACTSGLVVAWMKDESKVVNSFKSADVDIEIKEEFDGKEKSDVCIHNTSTISAFVRVKLVANWEDKEGNIINADCSLKDLDIIWGDKLGSEWVLKKDGYYYYKSELVPDAVTETLIKTATVKNADGKILNLHILAQAIQSSPDEAVIQAWGITPAGNGKLY